MADQYDDDMKGAAWTVDDRKSDKAPHFTGNIMADGRKYHLRVYDTGETGRKPALKFYLQRWEDYQAEVERRKAERGDSRPHARASQADRPRDTRPPLQREEPPPFEDSDVPW